MRARQLLSIKGATSSKSNVASRCGAGSDLGASPDSNGRTHSDSVGLRTWSDYRARLYTICIVHKHCEAGALNEREQ